METKLVLLMMCLAGITSVPAQNKGVLEANPEDWSVFNREVYIDNGIVHLDAQEDDGLLWLNDRQFKNGTIELDIKGKDTPGRSFVGVAFHGKDNETFDGVYFRPFNFKNHEKKSNSIQYIAMPDNGWSVLRKSFPGKYESTIDPLPEVVDDWFHVKIVVHHPRVEVFVNGSDTPTLVVDQLSTRKGGNLGFWVGNGSEGWFKNLKITDTK